MKESIADHGDGVRGSAAHHRGGLREGTADSAGGMKEKPGYAATQEKGRAGQPEAPGAKGIARTAVDTAGGTATIAAINPAKDKTPTVTTVAVVNIPRELSSFATQALREAEREGTGDETVMATETGGKNKLRGIFRRVTRAFGKTADRDNEGQREVLISAFQVALK